MTPITIQRTFYKIGDFVSWQKAGTLELSPEFQRRSVWKPGAKSYLIDTIVRGLPIPIIFLRDKRTDLTTFDPVREVVDGQQRLRTVLAYIGGPDLLPDYDPGKDDFTVKSAHNKELAGQRFPDLSPDIQRQIVEYQFNVHVLPSWVDDRQILEIFRRMNSTSYNLTAQELRNAAYFGEFKTSMYRLATEQLHRWRAWKVFSEDNINRMQEVELTSEFAIMMLKGAIGAKSQPTINNAYRDYDVEYPQQAEVERRFRIVMDAIDDKLGREMAQLIFSKKSMIYSLFVFFYDVLFGLDSPLEEIQQKSISPEQIAWIKLAGDRIENRTAPDPVLQASERRATNPKERRILFEYFQNRLANVQTDNRLRQ